MKFLCVSDQIDPLVYSTAAKERFKDIDAIFCAGDLPLDYIDFIVSTLNKPTYFIFGNHNLSEFHLYHKTSKAMPVKGYSANDLASQLAFKGFGHGAEYAGFKVLKCKFLPITNKKINKKTPLLVAGVSGSIRYNNGLNQYTDRQMFFKLLQMTPRLFLNKLLYGRYVDIFLTHATPRHVHDLEDKCHRGFECYSWFIKKFSPQYLIHGHIHLYDSRAERVSKVEDTTIVNAFGYTIIELPDTI